MDTFCYTNAMQIVKKILPTVSERIRKAGGRFLVPDTLQWGNWTDRQAIRQHGIYVGNLDAEEITDVLVGCWQEKGWDGQEVSEDPSYNELFALADREAFEEVE
jgi:hypothetical protein